MTVKELIEELQKIDEQDEEVVVYYCGDRNLLRKGGRAFIDSVEDLGGKKIIYCVNRD